VPSWLTLERSRLNQLTVNYISQDTLTWRLLRSNNHGRCHRVCATARLSRRGWVSQCKYRTWDDRSLAGCKSKAKPRSRREHLRRLTVTTHHASLRESGSLINRYAFMLVTALIGLAGGCSPASRHSSTSAINSTASTNATLPSFAPAMNIGSRAWTVSRSTIIAPKWCSTWFAPHPKPVPPPQCWKWLWEHHYNGHKAPWPPGAIP